MNCIIYFISFYLLFFISIDWSANIVFDSFMIMLYYCTCIWFAFAAAIAGGIVYIYICTCDGVGRTGAIRC